MKTVSPSPGAYRGMLDTVQARSHEAPAWLVDLRDAAMSRFESLGFPSTQLEEWKYTDVGRVRRSEFELPARTAVTTSWSAIPFSGVPATACMVFVDGRFAPQLSNGIGADPTGPVRLRTLSMALEDSEPAFRDHFTHRVDYHDRAFVALNTALFEDAAVIDVADGARIERPVHVAFVSAPASEPVLVSPRLIVRIGRNAGVRLIESYVGAAGGMYLTNAVTEVSCGEGATLEQLRFQNEAEEGIHIATQRTHLGRDSTFHSTSVSIGGSLVRYDLDVTLGGRGAECRLNGLYLGSGRQHIDNHTFVDHAVAQTFSRELYKGILAGRSRGVFNGAILVRQDAQQVSATQQNRNLLLSDDAVIDTKPELQILANDVKCSHGATIGQLQPDALFYLRTRGLDLAEARRTLTQAFAAEVIDSIGDEHLADACRGPVGEWMSRHAGVR